MFFKEKNHFDKGTFGENKACKYLKKQGYKILERNFKTSFAEIDIIAEKDGLYIFVEVKTRKLRTSIPASVSVNYYKQQKIIKAACCYMAKEKIKPFCRFDIVEVYTDDEMKNFKINHIENAFESRSLYAVF